MTDATKRILGVSGAFIGGQVLTVGGLAYIGAEKAFRATEQLRLLQAAGGGW